MRGMTIANEVHWLQALDTMPAADAARSALSSSSLFETDRLADIAPELISAIEAGQPVLTAWLAVGTGDHFLLAQVAPRLVRALRRMEADAFLAATSTAA